MKSSSLAQAMVSTSSICRRTLKLFRDAMRMWAKWRRRQKVLFVGTTRQAQEGIAEDATRVSNYYVNPRCWAGSSPNNITVQKSIKRIPRLDDMASLNYKAAPRRKSSTPASA